MGCKNVFTLKDFPHLSLQGHLVFINMGLEEHTLPATTHPSSLVWPGNILERGICFKRRWRLLWNCTHTSHITKRAPLTEEPKPCCQTRRTLVTPIHLNIFGFLSYHRQDKMRIWCMWTNLQIVAYLQTVGYSKLKYTLIKIDYKKLKSDHPNVYMQLTISAHS